MGPQRSWLDRAEHIDARLAGASELDRKATSRVGQRRALLATLVYAGLRIGGPSHRDCAIVCVKRGIPMALIEKGTSKSYVLIPGHDKVGLPPELINEMHYQLQVHGDIVTRGGTSFLAVRSWERL